MKNIRFYTLLALLLMAGSGTSFGQSAKQIFIGTEPGEIIIQKQWYEYTFMGYKYNLCRFTDHGAHVDIIATYDDLTWLIDTATMSGMGELLYDRAPGHFYNLDYSVAEKVLVTEDYGQSWRAIDDYMIPSPPSYWCFANESGEIVKLEPDEEYNYSFIASYDYGTHFDDTIITFTTPVYIKQVAGWNHGEFFYKEIGTDRWFYTTDFSQTVDTLTFPHELSNYHIGIGPMEGELYGQRYSSKFTKLYYSDDYGANFRTLIDSKSNPIDIIVDDSIFCLFDIRNGGTVYLDREPGVFYVCLDTLSYNFTEWGTPVEEPQGDRCYIAYYRAYGDTLVTTYYHDFKPDWFEHHTPVMDCEIVSCGESSVTLHWNEPELKPDEVLVGYRVYRGVTMVREDLITEMEYTDNISGGGRLNYHVLAVYSDGETSKSYNIVYCEQTEGVDENGGETAVIIYPNPTNGTVTIDGLEVAEVKVYNVLGQLVKESKENVIDLSEQQAGIYIIKVITPSGVITKQIIKN